MLPVCSYYPLQSRHRMDLSHHCLMGSCGSRTHTLSRCPKPVPPRPKGNHLIDDAGGSEPYNPLPFASCFVCLQQGHLASTCPRNKHKGVYPRGGSCKLCGEKTHLAKDCELNKRPSNNESGNTRYEPNKAGADEDDFHMVQRNNVRSNAEAGGINSSMARSQKGKRQQGANLSSKSSHTPLRQSVQDAIAHTRPTLTTPQAKRPKVVNF